ncbi:DUF262 domain-containing protein [Pseudomonas aeruginosa]|uniref:DUF262 domain-containing protein n=1 Tax=Pseudomonas aeruginosa TaxID=287 RepID=UPI000F53BBD5|nr:DUF262 domain-containing protein [Pseudomonas aeruginosa]MBG7423247.1 DUF262 domain-containing protein [Pseudomonas aeruginosa]MDI4099064.1 DUF262 domain-containing protein [Pseudomonas aeruginosa]RPW07909.1 hypothetical protein IPC776_10495 [Pseudomonas aeruginosa]WCW06084.1 DUF262 domain-containing protein [Pseudomonas aeruginosa]HBO5139326.1 DUF262 domain-containing protein [Pseudomonas aeruginosa]
MSNNVKRILKRFVDSQSALVLQQSDLSLQSISDMVDSGAIDVSPKYQRRERWGLEKNSGLIESFLLNIPVPPIYLAEDEYGVYSVIDGKQRVTAINKFLNGEFSLTDLEKFVELEGCSFGELPDSLSNALKIRPYLRVVTLLRQSDPDLKHEVFLRLNKAGVALNSQEIRNVAFRGELNDMLFDMSEETYLRAQLKAAPHSKIYREMIDVQYVLRFFTVREYWKEFHGNMDVAMDSYMQNFHKASKRKVNALKTKFLQALEFCETVWGDEGFKKPGGNSRVLQGYYDVQMVCSSLLTDTERNNAMGKPDEARDALVSLLDSDEDFKESVSQFTSNPRSVEYRIRTYTEALKAL